MQSYDFTYKAGDNGEPLSALVYWSKDSSYKSEVSKPIGSTFAAQEVAIHLC